MKQWYLLYCKRGEQQRAKQHLENQGVECYYPEVDVEKILRGKKQLKKEPLFPSYIFIRFDYQQGPSFTAVRSTRGVVDFVRQGVHPHQLQEGLVVSLKEMESYCLQEPYKTLPKKGQRLRVTSGQFAGVEAMYQEPDGERRSILLVKMITQIVPISLDNKEIDL